ncbi:MAG: (deoxy)nucleoside triphosphate pyrophosphohydrolase [Victivallaceae bacterium]|nr:(deoxy)nucleoside triphosphate pyrophosphohydrolase [Victivallaceae bacterium]
MTKTIEVAAAVIERGEDVLVCSRPAGGFMAGCWEFPGGKLEPGETPAEAARRELAEELLLAGVNVLDTLAVQLFSYPEKRVRIHFLRCRISGGAEPVPCEKQEFRWVCRRRLHELDLLPADLEFAAALAR